MKTILVSGSLGLVGSETARFFHEKGYEILGIDNDMRKHLFGESASNEKNKTNIENKLDRYTHHSIDIRNLEEIESVFEKHNSDIAGIIHTAAQPSHDWAAKDPFTDFHINATGTLNLLECTRKYCPEAVFIFTSTNKVYGDRPNFLPFEELEGRWEVSKDHHYYHRGIDENMSIDNSKHSLFGVSKASADLLVQEYGKYFGIKTGIFRGGCLTGPAHSGTELHGFLSYLILCAIHKRKYTVYGYKGKQVRDNIHSYDLVNAFWEFFLEPRAGEVYNIGGSRHSNISVLEAIRFVKDYTGIQLEYEVSDDARIGDHIWYISDVQKFQNHFPNWRYKYDIHSILREMLDATSKSQ